MRTELAPLDYAPPDTPLAVIYADDALLALDKPAGLLTVPGKAADHADCLAARVAAAFHGARPVHRLDLATSGLVLFARTPAALRHLGLQFERRRVTKRYIALVEGHPAPVGEIDLPLTADWPNRPLQKVCPQGRAARTSWRMRVRSPAHTRLELRPETGRSHQLRVHCAAIGHPILGDGFYGDAASAPRLMLHAEHLVIRHPDGGADVALTAPCPF